MGNRIFKKACVRLAFEILFYGYLIGSLAILLAIPETQLQPSDKIPIQSPNICIFTQVACNLLLGTHIPIRTLNLNSFSFAFHAYKSVTQLDSWQLPGLVLALSCSAALVQGSHSVNEITTLVLRKVNRIATSLIKKTWVSV